MHRRLSRTELPYDLSIQERRYCETDRDTSRTWGNRHKTRRYFSLPCHTLAKKNGLGVSNKPFLLGYYYRLALTVEQILRDS